jgi:hypothetical protein
VNVLPAFAALFLARMRRENVVPCWRKALPYAGLGLAVAVAGTFFVRSARRSRAG